MLNIYEIWALMIYGVLLLLLAIVIYPIIFHFKNTSGKKRRIIGELLRDLGIALLVGSSFKWGILELSFYLVMLIGVLFIIIGTIMKEDNK